MQDAIYYAPEPHFYEHTASDELEEQGSPKVETKQTTISYAATAPWLLGAPPAGVNATNCTDCMSAIWEATLTLFPLSKQTFGLYQVSAHAPS